MALTKTPVCDFGKKAEDFKLKSIDNKLISLKKRSIQDKYNKRINPSSKEIWDFPHNHDLS